MIVRELELDLDAFEGPFDLLLALVLKEELDLRDVDLAGIVTAFLERLAEREELDLEACGEFLVLIAALLELKARALFPDENGRARGARARGGGGGARAAARGVPAREGGRGVAARAARGRGRPLLPARPGAARAEGRDAARAAGSRGARRSALRLLAQEPPEVSLSHMALRFPPVSQFLERFRALLRRRSRFDFDTEVRELTRLEQASAFLAVLELRRAGELVDRAGGAVRADSRHPVSRRRTRPRRKDRRMDRPLRLIPADPLDKLARTLEALLVVASAPLSIEELAAAADDDPERIEEALRLVGERFAEGRSGIVLEHVAGGWAFRAGRDEAAACARLFERPGAAEPLAGRARDARDRRVPRPVHAAGHRADPRCRRRLRRREPRRARPDRRGRP